MTIISPSLLACDFLNIEKEIKAINKIKDLWFHLDIMDGHFVPNLTFGQPIIKKISTMASHPLDAHLMVTNPEFHIETMKDFNIHNITFHLEALNNDTNECLKLMNLAKKYYPSVGISIKPNTPVSAIDDSILLTTDLILMMSVEPGFGGQSFIENTYQKLIELSDRRTLLKRDFQIQVDGGVNDNNAKKLTEHFVDNLVAGSYVFKAGEKKYKHQIQLLR